MIRAISLVLLLAVHPVYADSITGRVVKVYDGDPVTILDDSNAQHRIRLQGIDAPERGQAYGKKSGKNLANAVAGKHAIVEYKKHDRYKRIVGKVLLNGQDMNIRQVEAGLAWHYKKYQREQSQEDKELYSDAEIEARRARRGLWQEPDPAPPWKWRERKRSSR